MGWGLGYNSGWQRDVGYSVPAYCDHPKCTQEIDRGLGHVCGGEPPCSDGTCQLFFCSDHLYYSGSKLHAHGSVCARCKTHRKPFRPKPEHWKWVTWKLYHVSWQQWRRENPAQMAALLKLFGQYINGTAVEGVAPISRETMLAEMQRAIAEGA